MKVEIYSDVVCPWCYIGERRFRRALAAYPGADRVEVVYRSYQLDPDAPAEAVPLMEYLRKRFGASVDGMLARVTENAAGEGIEMAWDRAQAVNTLTAHRVLRLAEQEYGADVQRALAERLFEAHFSRGSDVSDHELLAELAESVGMDRARVQAYLASGAGEEETRREIEQARRLGVTAVPTFVFEGRWAVQGAQPASTFLQALEEVAKQMAGAGAASGRASGGEGDDAAPDADCADGSCAV
ncbi:MAG TPA: DsbA family oxidoreductase [Longimicrobiales bacterium]